MRYKITGNAHVAGSRLLTGDHPPVIETTAETAHDALAAGEVWAKQGVTNIKITDAVGRSFTLDELKRVVDTLNEKPA